MKRILLLVVGAMALALTAPSVAAAHGGHHRGHHKSQRHHHKKAHKTKVRRVQLDPITTPGDKPGTPAANAGTIASFDNGVLTITLADGSTVSGAVTSATRIVCSPPPPTGPAAKAAHDRGDHRRDGHNSPGARSACGTDALTAGAVVHVAELRIGAAGAQFGFLKLNK